MIQLNLLPAIKLEYVKARRARRLALLGSAIVAGASLLVFVLLFGAVQWQTKTSGDLSKDIKTESDKLQSVEDLAGILTVQNQLKNLQDLHKTKPEVYRLGTHTVGKEQVAGYIEQTTPSTSTVSSVSIDFIESTVTIDALAHSAAEANLHIDTLKFTTYTAEKSPIGGEPAKDKSAFSEVVLGTLTPDSQTGEVTYAVSFKFDPDIFSNQVGKIQLTVPEQVTTRSQIDKPGSLFEPRKEQ